MEFADIILYLLYFAIAAAVAVVLWSYVRMRCRSTGRGAVQNGIRMRILNSCVWLFVAAVVVCARFAGDGSAADIMLITLAILIVVLVILVAWSMFRRR